MEPQPTLEHSFGIRHHQRGEVGVRRVVSCCRTNQPAPSQTVLVRWRGVGVDPSKEWWGSLCSSWAPRGTAIISACWWSISQLQLGGIPVGMCCLPKYPGSTLASSSWVVFCGFHTSEMKICFCFFVFWCWFFGVFAV